MLQYYQSDTCYSPSTSTVLLSRGHHFAQVSTAHPWFAIPSPPTSRPVGSGDLDLSLRPPEVVAPSTGVFKLPPPPSFA